MLAASASPYCWLLELSSRVGLKDWPLGLAVSVGRLFMEQSSNIRTKTIDKYLDKTMVWGVNKTLYEYNFKIDTNTLYNFNAH